MPAPPDFCRFFATVPDTRFGEDRHRVHGHRGVSEWTYTGTTATGQHIHARGCESARWPEISVDARKGGKRMVVDTLTITESFCGPSKTGNGGYVAGLLARHLQGAVTVRLVKGVPLEVEMRVESEGEALRLMDGNTLVAQAHRSELELEPPAPPSFQEAEAATQSFVAYERHPFPRCIVCGTQRESGDGLRIFPGVVPGRFLFAAPWVPHPAVADESGSVRLEFLWASLECPAGFAWYPNLVVMGELTGRVQGSLRVGEKCVVTGWPIERDGRKYYAGTAIHGEDGRAVAVGHSTWIEIGRDAFITLSRTGKSDP
jgi:hypothetical protein